MQIEYAPIVPPLMLTNHARERAQARGVSMRIVEAIYANAYLCPFVGNGCQSLMVSRRKLDRLADSIPAADRERMKGVVLVVDPNSNAMITVLHALSPNGRRYRRQRHLWKRCYNSTQHTHPCAEQVHHARNVAAFNTGS